MTIHGIFPIAVGGLFIGGNALIIFKSYELFNKIMPSGYAIQNAESGTNETSGKKLIKQVYGNYLVDADDPRNESGGKGTYRNMPTKKYEDNTFIQNLTNGSQANITTSINHKCKSIYEQEISKLSDIQAKNMGTYCSIGRAELVTLDKDGNDSQTEIQKKLVSTEHYSNIGGGKIRKSEFESKKLTSQHYNTSKKIMETCENFYYATNTIEENELLKICGFNY